MRAALQSHLDRSGLLPPRAKVLVGYSGGADSTCLLTLLVGCGFDVVAAHLHHGQRLEAELEMRLCEAYADQLGVPFVGGRADVPQMAEDLGIGLEEAGRHARDEFLRRAALQLDCDCIATAHTKDDLIETMLFQMARGTGLNGLKGISERDGVKVRPLLPFSRSETREFCRSEGLWFHDDPANEDLSFSRARIRHRVLPELRLVHPGFEEAMVRLAKLVETEDGFLNGMAAAALEQIESPLNGALGWLTRDVEAAFHRGRLAGLPPVLLNRALRLGVATLGSSLDHHQTLTAARGICGSETGAITTESNRDGGAVTLEWSEQFVHLSRTLVPEPFRHPLTVPGETLADEFGWAIEAWHEVGSAIGRDAEMLRVTLDAGAVKGGQYFRSAQASDRVVPLGWTHGPRALSDLLADKRLTHAARKRLPVVCDLVGPVWCPGVFLADRCKVTEATSTLLKLSFAQIGHTP